VSLVVIQSGDVLRLNFPFLNPKKSSGSQVEKTYDMKSLRSLAKLRSQVLSIDLESTAVADFKDLSDVRANVVVVFDPLSKKKHRFVRDEALHVVGCRPLSELRERLYDWFMEGRILGGQNILGFDFPVLMNDTELGVKEILQAYLDAQQYVDTLAHLKTRYGIRISLKHMVTGTLGDDKLMDGADAPAEWERGNYSEVIDYCVQDTVLWSNLYVYGRQHGFVYVGDAKFPVEW